MKTEFPKRKNLRLRDFDYSTPGAYFITICTFKRKNTLSDIVGAIHESPVSKLTECGEIVEQIIRELPTSLGVIVDRYVIMPNHIHLILCVVPNEHKYARSKDGRSIISKAVGYIKMNATKAIRDKHGPADVWQRGFHDHIIRDRDDYANIAEYIDENVLKWHLDSLNPEAISNDE